MKKRKILMLTLPLVGVATIVGSGFSAWYFNETTVSTSAKLGVAVTEMHVTAGELTTTLPANAKIVLDQGGASFANDLTQKIYVGTPVTGDTYTPVNSFDVTFTIPTASANGLKDSGIKGHFTLTPTVNETLLKYINVDTTLLTFTKDFTFATAEELTSPWSKTIIGSNTIYKVTISLAASNAATTPFSYKANSTAEGANPGKPLTSAQYTAMKTALTGVSNAISFAGSVVFEIA